MYKLAKTKFMLLIHRGVSTIHHRDVMEQLLSSESGGSNILCLG